MDKQELRTRMASVANPSAETASGVVRNLRDWFAPRLPGTVAAYLAMPSEIDVSSLFAALPGWRWSLVRVEPDGTVSFRDRAVPVETHPLGMRQPMAEGTPIKQSEIDVYLVPGVAFTAAGSRLGRGGGFYDRILGERRADALAIGVTHEARVVGELPVTERDEAVDLLATETGIRECLPSR